MSGPAAPPRPRDWLAEAHLIARSAPGLGNPLDLTCAEFEAHLVFAARGFESQQPKASDAQTWARRYVEQSIR
jgi:hypothetical protein